MDQPALVVAAPTAGPARSVPCGDGDRAQHLRPAVVEIALGAGAELTEHSAPAPIIVQVLEGAVDFEVGQARPISSGLRDSFTSPTLASDIVWL